MIEEPRLLDQLRDRIRLKHYSIRTEKTYFDWNRRFILFYIKKHPRDMGTKEVEQFLSYLAVNGRVASSTQCDLFLKCRLRRIYLFPRSSRASFACIR